MVQTRCNTHIGKEMKIGGDTVVVDEFFFFSSSSSSSIWSGF